MTAITGDVAHAELPRRRQTFIATGMIAASAALVVVMLVGRYLQLRADASVFLDQVSLPLTQPNVMLAAFVLSVLSMQWVVWAVSRDERSQAYWALGITFLLGVAVLDSTWYLLSQSGLAVGTQPEAPLLFAVVGAHVAMVVVGLGMIAVNGFRTFAGQYGSRYPDAWSATAVWWYTTTAVYVLIWYAVYVTK